MGRFVSYEESPANQGKYILKINVDEFPFSDQVRGSYNVMLARIAGLSYANFLRTHTS